MTKKITVKKVFENTSKTSGKQYWTVYTTTDGEKFSVWDGHLMTGLQEGLTANVAIEEKGQYKNITAVVPDAFLEDDDDNPFLEPTPAPAAKPAPKPELPEVKLAIAERISAMEAAVTLAAAGQIAMANLYDHADQILAYYQGVRPTNAKEAPKKSEAEEYIR